MRILLCFLVVANFSCISYSHKPESPINSEWVLRDSTEFNNIYRSDGLLEITYKTNYHYFRGQLVLVSKDIITKDYDNKKNLINKKTFSENLKELSEEEIWKYDSSRNLLSNIQKTDSILEFSEENIYNKKNQLVKYIRINHSYKQEGNWNIDSGLGGKRHAPRTYDTFMVNYKYNLAGELVEPKDYNSANIDPGYSVDSTKSGDTLITYLKTPLDTLIRWCLNRLLIKSTSHHSGSNDRDLYLYRYNQKGDEVEELHYISVKK